MAQTLAVLRSAYPNEEFSFEEVQTYSLIAHSIDALVTVCDDYQDVPAIEGDKLLDGADMVYFFTDYLSHSTYGMIEDVIKAGAKNYEDVEKQLRFGTGCGKCKEFIRFLTIRFGISLKPIQSVDQSDLP